MSKAICTGGMGKNPAIEKINQLNETSSRMQAAAVLERRALQKKENEAKEVQYAEGSKSWISSGFVLKGENRSEGAFYR